MAKADAQAESAATARSGKMGWLIAAVVGLLAVGGGFAVPLFLFGAGGHKENTEASQGKMAADPKHAFIPFGEPGVVVNLNEDRLTRYLKVKLILVVDIQQEKPITELVQKSKAMMKNWLLTYLSDRSLEEVKGAPGVNRLRREIQDQFNSMLFPDGSERIRDVLFEEFVVQ